MLEILALCLTLFLGVWWGRWENRAWKEHGEAYILGHFKEYHLFMAVLFGAINAIVAGLLLGFTFEAFLLWIWLMIWDVLILDVVWWFIRGYDFYMDYMKAFESYKEPNAQPLASDWDNCPIYRIRLNPLRIEAWKPPLFLGVYWWWWLFFFVLIGLGAGILFV